MPNSDNGWRTYNLVNLNSARWAKASFVSYMRDDGMIQISEGECSFTCRISAMVLLTDESKKQSIDASSKDTMDRNSAPL